MKVLARLLIVLGALWCSAAAFAADPAAVSSALNSLLGSSQRMELPVERNRAALAAFYVTNHAAPYWVGTPHMDHFMSRLNLAIYDGLNKADYPIIDCEIQPRDKLIHMRRAHPIRCSMIGNVKRREGRPVALHRQFHTLAAAQ